MPTVFSFVKHPIINLLEKSGDFIFGIDKAIALFHNELTGSVNCLSKDNRLNNSNLTQLEVKDISGVQNLRKKRPQYNWVSENNLPFEVINKGIKQLEIFDELDNVVLSLGFKSTYDKKTDYLFLYLNKNKGNFGISNSNKQLTTDEKNIIGSLVYNSMNVLMKQSIEDRKTLNQINQKVSNLRDENTRLHNQIINLQQNYLSSLVEMCKNHLKDISAEYNVKFQLSQDAIEKLQYFNGKSEELKEALTKSAMLALNLNFGVNDSIIVLKAWDIDFGGKNDTIIEEQSSAINVDDRYKKTYELLNKLENAARKVLNNQLKLTSENVGSACPTPITAPAISDALKNHKNKMLTLMKKHPEKWQTLRAEFRPVKNIINNANAS